MMILIAEDDEETAELMAAELRVHGHEVVGVGCGEDALTILRNADFDLVILDRMLPGLDGLDVLRNVRERDTPASVLMVTALGGIADRVEGLEAGADDYLVKPFAMSELVARAHALQRRHGGNREPTTLRHGRIVLDTLRRELRVEGKLVPLQPREFRLLEELVRGRGETLTRPMLLQKVWHLHFEPQTNIVETHMSRLRTKLALAGLTDVVQTVRGSGYRLRAAD